MFRRLDDKVRELCAWALASQDPVELHEIATQLRAALREHIKRVRLSAVNAPLTERRGNPQELVREMNETLEERPNPPRQ